MACENRRRKQQSHATTLHELDVRGISFTNVDAPFVAIPRRTTAYEDDKLRIEWEVTMFATDTPRRTRIERCHPPTTCVRHMTSR